MQVVELFGLRIIAIALDAFTMQVSSSAWKCPAAMRRPPVARLKLATQPGANTQASEQLSQPTSSPSMFYIGTFEFP
jgi:hypothetical protein